MFSAIEISSHGLDQHERTTGRERLADVAGRTDGIAHVMQSVKDAGEVISFPGKILGLGYVELDVGNAGGRGFGLSFFNRRTMQIDAVDRRIWIGLGHQHSRGAVATAYVGHFSARLELGLYARKCGYPIVDQVSLVAGPKKSVGATE